MWGARIEDEDGRGLYCETFDATSTHMELQSTIVRREEIQLVSTRAGSSRAEKFREVRKWRRIIFSCLQDTFFNNLPSTKLLHLSEDGKHAVAIMTSTAL